LTQSLDVLHSQFPSVSGVCDHRTQWILGSGVEDLWRLPFTRPKGVAWSRDRALDGLSLAEWLKPTRT